MYRLPTLWALSGRTSTSDAGELKLSTFNRYIAGLIHAVKQPFVGTPIL